MAGVDDRRYDVKDILDRATYGWVAPPDKPTLVVESTQHPRGSYLGQNAGTVAGGVFYIKKDYTYEREKHHPKYETRLWAFPCVLVEESFIELQGLFDQAREVFDRYTNPTANTPFSTSTLGTSTTYTYAGIEKGVVSTKANRYEMDVIVYLREQFVDVKVA